MKLLIILLLSALAFAQSLAISIDAPQIVEVGETFTISADIKNIGSTPVGTDTSPVIATVVSTNNCIINSAKIIGIIAPGETKYVSWVVTAPSSGICVLTVSAGTFSETYARESRTVNVGSPIQQAGSGQGSGAIGIANESSAKTTESSAKTIPLEPGSVPEESPIITETTEESPKERTTEKTEALNLLLPAIAIIIICTSILIFYASHRNRKKRAVHKRHALEAIKLATSNT